MTSIIFRMLHPTCQPPTSLAAALSNLCTAFPQPVSSANNSFSHSPMAQIPQQENFRGNKRPRCDDGPSYPNNVPGYIVVPNYPPTGPPDLTVDASSDPNRDSHLLNNPFLHEATTVPELDYQQYPDELGFFVMDDVVSSSFEDFAYINRPSGPPSSDGPEDDARSSWEHLPDGHPSSDAAVASSQPTESPPNPTTRTSRTGPTEQEWKEREDFIKFLYGPEKPNLNLTLREVMEVMEKAGFLKGATDNMYKNRFLKWRIVKNESNATRRRRARRQQAASSICSGIHPAQSPDRPSSSAARGAGWFGEVVNNLRAICMESIKERPNGTWNLDDDLCVIDDDWEDAYGSAAALAVELDQNPDSPIANSPWETIQDDIAPMIQTLNYFSIPTTLMIAYMLCKKSGNAKVRHVPARFLAGCLQISRAEAPASPRHVWFTNLLEGLYNFAQQNNDVESLVEILSLTIPCYIQLVSHYGNREGATALSLLSFYHVQLRSDIPWLESTLEKITGLLERVEAAKGPDDKATVEVLGLAIMVLQETKHHRRLWREASKMRERTKRQLSKLPDGHPDREYYLNRFVDGYHVEIRLALEDKDKSFAIRLNEEYQALVREESKNKDGFARILELELENITSQLGEATLES